MRGHKYVKRTGTTGNYKYWYKLPDGTLTTGTERDQKRAQKEHATRLMAAKQAGHHDLTYNQIKTKTGVSSVGWLYTALRGGHDFTDHHLKESMHGDVNTPEYHDKIARNHGEITRDIPAGSAPLFTPEVEGMMRAEERRAATAAALRWRRIADAAAAAAASHPTDADVERLVASLGRTFVPVEPLSGAEVTYAARVGNGEILISKVSGDFVVRVRETAGEGGERVASGRAIFPSLALPDVITTAVRSHVQRLEELAGGAATAEAIAALSDEDRDEARRTKLIGDLQTRFNLDVNAYATPTEITPETAPEAVMSAAERARAVQAEPEPEPEVTEPVSEATLRAAADRARAALASHTDSPAGTPPSSDPYTEHELLYRESERVINDQIALQQVGQNPYIKRAKQLLDRVSDRLTDDRKKSSEMFLQAINNARRSGNLNKAEVEAQYNSLRTPTAEDSVRVPIARRHAFGAAKKHFEAATYHDLKEIIENKPIDREYEHAKRGYAHKQFERMKPFLRSEFTSEFPSAPPPMPTWGDLKTWTEHGENPDWNPVGGTGRAVPKEVFDAVPKKANGKPLYPPTWLPIHLMPAWNYFAGKEGESIAPAVYSGSDRTRGQEHKAPTQRISTRSSEGVIDFDPQGNPSSPNLTVQHFFNGLKRYVQMRGHGNMVDIPEHKIPDGVSRLDLFKADGSGNFSDEEFKKLICHKYIDSGEFIKFLQRQSKIRKSWKPVINLDATYIPGETIRPTVLIKSRPVCVADIRKSRIQKVRMILNERRAAN